MQYGKKGAGKHNERDKANGGLITPLILILINERNYLPELPFTGTQNVPDWRSLECK